MRRKRRDTSERAFTIVLFGITAQFEQVLCSVETASNTARSVMVSSNSSGKLDMELKAAAIAGGLPTPDICSEDGIYHRISGIYDFRIKKSQFM